VQHVEYVRNRFAYSLALDIFRQELQKHRIHDVTLADLRWLADVARFAQGIDATGSIIYEWLRNVPETVTLDSLRSGYQLSNLDETYDRYFGPVDEPARPHSFAMRGPLLFGIAESARARLFPDALLRDPTYQRAGALMNAGHDGDRRFDSTGAPWSFDCGDAALARLAAKRVPIEFVPGAYGASSRAMDALVDCAKRAGAVGASLTGAGIAGSVLALCVAGSEEAAAERLREFLASAEYAQLAGLSDRLSYPIARDGVVVNRAPSAACEVELPVTA
jgi:galactokinase